jgi:aminopeptidase N
VRARVIALLSAVALGLPAAAGASSLAVDYSRAVSQPRVDPYYPAKGDPSVDALHYRLDLDWDDAARRLDGRAVIRFRAPQAESVIQLDLARPLRPSTVTLDGVAVQWSHAEADLVVQAPATLARGSRHTLVVEYRGRPEPVDAPVTRSDFSTVGWTVQPNGQVWTMQEPWGAHTWYPVNDHPSDKAYYDLHVTTKAAWHGVSNGKLVSNTVTGDRRTTSWHLSSPAAAYLMTIAIGPYERFTDTGPHGLPITYWVRPAEQDDLGRLRRTPSMLRWLEKRLGPYPFDRAGAVVVPSQSAMETQTLVTMGNAVIDRWVGVPDLLHEYVHQWYGDSVTPDNWKDLWLNEGFAMYLQIRWEVTHGYRSMKQWRRTLVQYDQILRDAYGPPGEYDRGSWGSTNVYYCSALMLDRLKSKIGAAKFAKVLHGWPRRHRFDNVHRGQWVRWLNNVSGRDLRPFVHKWLTSEESPA